MKTYKYQLHTHTTPCSACSRMTPEELVESLHKGGYQGCEITNHFIGGNTGIERSVSWNDFVKRYVDDYLECCKYAKKYDMDIIFGIEEVVVAALEILCYGVTPEMLYAHPEFILVSGADAHRKDDVCCGGIETTMRIHNGRELISLLKSGEYELIKE